MGEAKAETDFESLPADCQRVLLIQTSRVAGEPVDAEQAAWFAAHLQACASCKALLADVTEADAAVRGAFSTTRLSRDFMARTMAALPATEAPQLRVYASEKPRRWKWSPVAAAAAVALLMTGLAFMAARLLSAPALALSLQKGKLVDEHGAAIGQVIAGRVCQAQEDTLLRGKHDELLNVRKGARFKVNGDTASMPEVHLEDGDLYASATRAGPVRMGCANFDAELNGGDCFLAQETSAIPQSVMILFDGNAQVMPRLRDPIHLSSGQIFVSVGLADDAYTDTLDVADYSAGRIPQSTENVDTAEMRRRYERQVTGYRAELAALNARIGALPAEDPAAADLRDRCERIQKYLHAHEARLKSLPRNNHPVSLPLDCIERGLKEHHDPKTWM